MRASIAIGVASALFAHAALAGTLAPSKPSDVVTLSNGPGDPCVVTGAALDSRVEPDGTATEFAVPPRSVLVVTGVDFTLSTDGAANVELFVEKAPNTTPIFVTTVTGGGGSATIPNVIVGSGSSLCIQATIRAGGTEALLAVVHGFLAKDK